MFYMKKTKTLHIKEYKLPITIHKEKDGGFSAKCTIWKNCYAQGDTLEEVITEISYVASSLIELYKEEGIKIPLKLKKESSQKEDDFEIDIPLIVSTN